MIEVRCKEEEWLKWGPVLCGAVPVGGVTLTDRLPDQTQIGFAKWHRWLADDPPEKGWPAGSVIAGRLFEAAIQAQPPGDMHTLVCLSAGGAAEQLSDACLWWARQINERQMARERKSVRADGSENDAAKEVPQNEAVREWLHAYCKGLAKAFTEPVTLEDLRPSVLRPRVSRKVQGKVVPVPLNEIWASLAKVIRLARISVCPGSEGDVQQRRLAFLEERLRDLDGLDFQEQEPC